MKRCLFAYMAIHPLGSPQHGSPETPTPDTHLKRKIFTRVLSMDSKMTVSPVDRPCSMANERHPPLKPRLSGMYTWVWWFGGSDRGVGPTTHVTSTDGFGVG